MKIERFRKNHKKEIIIGGLILVSIVSAITLVTTRAKYRVTQEIKLATGTVNYKPYGFKIIAMYQQNDSGTYSEINEMPTSGYAVNEEKSYCTTDNKTQVKGKLSTNSNGEHIFKNLKKSDKCYIWFDKKKEFANKTILASITNIKGIPAFTQTATTDEGVYAVSDGMYGGTSYYWRGASTTNHVIFANFCWRIIRINGDGSIRLIYDGTTCHTNGTSTSDSIAVTSQAYNVSYDRTEYVGWTYSTGTQRTTSGTASNIKRQTDTWYNNNIGNNEAYKEKVADGKFCNDRNVSGSWSSAPSSDIKYAAYVRLTSTYPPTISCPEGDVYTLKVGAITADEVVIAGGKNNYENSSYYLYNGQCYWTMSPSYWYYNSYSSRGVEVFYVNSDGKLGNSGDVYNAYGIRPVINLRSDITFSSGDGTQHNPYVVE